VATFSKTLPYGGNYHLNVGCGGSPEIWNVSVSSPTTSGSGHWFSCYDTTSPWACQITA
jgi:hypothetical protein